jgi:nitroreductase
MTPHIEQRQDMNESIKTPTSATPVSCDVSSSVAARYGDTESNVPLAWNDTMDLLLSHRSVRGFLSDPLPTGTLEALVAAAQSASTSSNVQAWTVIAVMNPETKAALSQIAGGQKHMEECPLLLVWCADLARTKTIGERHNYPTDATGFLESFVVSVVDAALAAQNAAVAAESFGLGMVYIGALRNNPQEVARLLKLPPNVVAAFGMCVGYPDPARPYNVKPRLPQRVVLHREHYDDSVPQEALDSYDATLSAFQRAEKMKEVGWIGTMKGRWRDAASIKGRDKIRSALLALGFKLD